MGFQRGGTQTDLQDICIRLRRALGPQWQVRPFELNAVHYGLPQNRPRIYIVGRKVSVLSSLPLVHPGRSGTRSELPTSST